MTRGQRKRKSLKELKEEIKTLSEEKDDMTAMKVQNEYLAERMANKIIVEKEVLSHMQDLLINQKKEVKEKEKAIRTLKSSLRKKNRNVNELNDQILSLERRKKLRENRVKRLKEFNPSRRGI